MDDTDLALIPIERLIEEIESRCQTFVLAYELPDDIKFRNQFITWFGKGIWGDSIKLAAILSNDCLNSWNGELKTLRRINNEEEGYETTS